LRSVDGEGCESGFRPDGGYQTSRHRDSASATTAVEKAAFAAIPHGLLARDPVATIAPGLAAYPGGGAMKSVAHAAPVVDVPLAEVKLAKIPRTGGHHPWETSECEQFEKCYAIGTRERLA